MFDSSKRCCPFLVKTMYIWMKRNNFIRKSPIAISWHDNKSSNIFSSGDSLQKQLQFSLTDSFACPQLFHLHPPKNKKCITLCKWHTLSSTFCLHSTEWFISKRISCLCREEDEENSKWFGSVWTVYKEKLFYYYYQHPSAPTFQIGGTTFSIQWKY